MPATARYAGISVGPRWDCCSSYWSVRLCNLPNHGDAEAVVAVTAEAVVAVIAHACR
jgi:hypothetical protein